MCFPYVVERWRQGVRSRGLFTILLTKGKARVQRSPTAKQRALVRLVNEGPNRIETVCLNMNYSLLFISQDQTRLRIMIVK